MTDAARQALIAERARELASGAFREWLRGALEHNPEYLHPPRPKRSRK